MTGILGGISQGINGVLPQSPFFPLTGTALTGRIAITPDSVYLCSESSGNMLDVVTTNHLVAVGTPVYRTFLAAQPGLRGDSVDDAFSADVHDLALSSGIYAEVIADLVPQASARFMFGRYAAERQLWVNVFVGGVVRAAIFDGTTTVTIVPTGDPAIAPYVPYLTQVQVDRAAAMLRFRMSGLNGQVLSGELSIAAVGTLSGGTTPKYYSGAAAGFRPGTDLWHRYGFVARGAQCEGASVLASNAQRLGFE